MCQPADFIITLDLAYATFVAYLLEKGLGGCVLKSEAGARGFGCIGLAFKPIDS